MVRVAEPALPATDVAAVVRLYRLRHWVAQSSTQGKYARGWRAYQVRNDHALRRHWALVCCAFRCCWWASGEEESAVPRAAASPPAPAPADEPVRGENVRPRPRPQPTASQLAGGAAPGAGLVGAVDPAGARLARLVDPAATPTAARPARLGGAGSPHRAL